MKLSYGIPLIDTLTPEQFEEYLILLKDIGYEGVEASVCHAKEIDRKMLKEKLNKYEMCFSGFRSGAVYDLTGVRFSSPDKTVRDKALEMVKDVVDLCEEFECPILVGRMQGRLEKGEEAESAKTRIKDCMRRVAEYAAKSGTIIAFEPINRFEMDYNHTAKEMVAFVNEINEGLAHKVSLLMDIYNMALEESSIAAAFIRSQKLLAHVHFRDSNNGVPGTGNIDFADALKVLEAMDYKGWIALEVAFDFCDYAEGARNSMAYLKPLIQAAKNCR